MAVRWLDGFDHWSDSGGKWIQRYDFRQGGSTVDTDASVARFGYGRALSWSGADPCVIAKNGLGTGASAETIIGCAFRPTALTGGGNIFNFSAVLADPDPNRFQSRLRIRADGSLNLIGGTGAVLNETTAPLWRAGQSRFLDLKIRFPSGLGGDGYCIVRVDEVEVINVSGSTADALERDVGAHWDRLGIGGGQQGSIDDLHVLDDTGSENNDWWGDVRLQTSLVNADGSVIQMTRVGGSAAGNYTAVSQNPDDGDSSYVKDNVVGHRDMYKVPNLVGNVVEIKTIAVEQVIRKDDATVRTFRPLIGQNGTIDNTAPAKNVGGSYIYEQQDFPLNPDTSAAWTPTERNSATFEVGQEVVT